MNMRRTAFRLLRQILAFLLAATCLAQLPDERAVRAAYVLNVTKFVEWPVEQREITIGFLGRRETGEFLQKMLDGRTNDSRPIRVRLFPSLGEVQQCSIVYIADSEKKTRALLDSLGTRRILTIGEEDWFTQEGGIVGLVKAGEQIRMEINVEAAQRAGLSIDPHLLALATIVRTSPKIASGKEERKVLNRTEPEYPAIAERMGLHGTVKLRLKIAPDGNVRSAECLGGHPLLAESALNAAKRWKYEPAAKESVLIEEINF